MRLTFERSLLQNDAFSATLLHVAAKAYYDEKQQRHGLPMPLILLVLPLVYHRETAAKLVSKRRPSILAKALAENRDLALGLQERMEGMVSMSMDAVRLGICTGAMVIDDDGESMELIPGERQPSAAFSSEDARMMNRAARAVGNAFSECTIPQLGEFLLVRF